jgi:4-hydroxy-tetrahydrodipicolinate reductase
MSRIKVLVSGAAGKMGSESVKAVSKDAELELVGQVSKGSELNAAITHSGAQVVIDFTNPESAFKNAKTILEAGARLVSGTTGFTPKDITELQKLAKAKKLGGLIAPNFSIGAILMMRFSAEAAKYFSKAEIIEKHHDQKLDAPSGTAIKTAEMMTKIANSNLKNVPIHSVRLPGYVADQEVIFGGLGQRLKIVHESINREAFMPGVTLACKKVMTINELVYGLEHLL